MTSRVTSPGGPGEVERRTRVGAYAVCRDEAGRVLLCRMSGRTRSPGAWTLPGGGVRHGEDPADAVLRELAEETGLAGRIVGLVGVHSNVYDSDGASIHAVRLLYALELDRTGTVSAGQDPDGGVDTTGWFEPESLAGMELSAHARATLVASPKSRSTP